MDDSLLSGGSEASSSDMSGITYSRKDSAFWLMDKEFIYLLYKETQNWVLSVIEQFIPTDDER